MTSFDYRGNPISEQMTPVERAYTEDVMSELTYTPGPGTGTNHNNPTQTTPGMLTREDAMDAMEKMAHLCGVTLDKIFDLDRDYDGELGGKEREKAVDILIAFAALAHTPYITASAPLAESASDSGSAESPAQGQASPSHQ